MNDTAASGAPSVVIERTVDAPRPRVWKMWTEAEHFAAWYGPTGATVPVAEMDVTVGGRRRVTIEMGTPEGVMQMSFVGEYRTVDEPNRLVYTEAMADPDGNVLTPEQAGFPDGHPTVTEVIVELADHDDGTRMTVTHRGIPADSPGAMGWNMALDKLEARLAA